MKKNDDRAFGWEWLAMLVMAVVVYACAIMDWNPLRTGTI